MKWRGATESKGSESDLNSFFWNCFTLHSACLVNFRFPTLSTDFRNMSHFRQCCQQIHFLSNFLLLSRNWYFHVVEFQLLVEHTLNPFLEMPNFFSIFRVQHVIILWTTFLLCGYRNVGQFCARIYVGTPFSRGRAGTKTRRRRTRAPIIGPAEERNEPKVRTIWREKKRAIIYYLPGRLYTSPPPPLVVFLIKRKLGSWLREDDG